MMPNDSQGPRNERDPRDDAELNIDRDQLYDGDPNSQGPDISKLEQLYDSRTASRRTNLLTILIIITALLLVGVIFFLFILPRLTDEGPGDETTTTLTTTQPSESSEPTLTSEPTTTASLTRPTTSEGLTETSSSPTSTETETTTAAETTTVETTTEATTEATTTEATTTEATTQEATTTTGRAETEPVDPYDQNEDFGLWAGEQSRLFTTADVNLRSEPDPNAEVITVIPSGTQIEIIDQLDGWKEIRYGVETGFIVNSYAETFAYNSSPEDRSYYIMTDTQLLAEADRNTDILAELPANTPVDVLSRNLDTGWHRIRVSGQIGHVPADVISYTMNAQEPGFRDAVSEADLIGTWDKRVFDKSWPDMTLGFNQVLEFRDDGTFTFTHMQLYSEGYSYDGSWSLSGETLTLTYMEMPESELFEINPDAYPNHTLARLGVDGNSLYLTSTTLGDPLQALMENTPFLRAG